MYMYRVLFLFFLLFNSSYFPQSFEVKGVGEGPTIEIAKEEALTDLSQKIMVYVKSEFTSNEIQKVESDQWIKQNKEEFDTYKNKIISLKSELPLLSPKFQNEKFDKNFFIKYFLIILYYANRFLNVRFLLLIFEAIHSISILNFLVLFVLINVF